MTPEQALKKQASEFGGVETKDTHGIQPAVPTAPGPRGEIAESGHEDLTASDKLRLSYLTGQDETQEAPTDRSA